MTQSVSLNIVVFYLKDHPLNIQFRIFHGQLFANSYNYIAGVGTGARGVAEVPVTLPPLGKL